MMEPHAIIGILLLTMLFFQAPLGYLHHKGYATTGGRTFYTYLHLGIGRLMIPLGIINGIMGVQLSNGEVWKEVTITFVGGSMWLLYLIAMIVGEWRRSRNMKQGKRSHLLTDGYDDKSPLSKSSKSSSDFSPALPATPKKARKHDVKTSYGYDDKRRLNIGRPQPYYASYTSHS
jgi:hypothetical protein